MKEEQRQETYWLNRTHNALNGLFGNVQVRPATISVVLGHTMDYGVFLELANDGKHAILKPTLDGAADRIVASYERLWEGV